MTQDFYIGVDGGATKSVVRVEDAEGNLLGQATNGPANIRISVEQAWQSIHAALEMVLQPLALAPDQAHRFHVGMGLAGCEMHEAYQAFLSHAHPFRTLIVSSDSHAACVGAHGGHDGAIIIAGTGVVGFQIEAGESVRIGGWGFPHDDEGGGAWMGLEAVKATLQWLDGRLPESGLAKAVYEFFGEEQSHLVSWTNNANSAAFAELAPLVIYQAETGDSTAKRVMQQAAVSIDRIGHALEFAQNNRATLLPCSLVGGIAPYLQPHLNETLRARIKPCQFTPDAGAVFLIRKYLAKEKHG